MLTVKKSKTKYFLVVDLYAVAILEADNTTLAKRMLLKIHISPVKLNMFHHLIARALFSYQILVTDLNLGFRHTAM